MLKINKGWKEMYLYEKIMTAYPTCVNDKTAFSASSRLLKNVKVASYLEKRMKVRYGARYQHYLNPSSPV